MKQIWIDIRQGKNIDIYVGVITSVAIAILGALKIVNVDIMIAVVLASVAIFIRHILANKRLHEKVYIKIEKLSPSIDELKNKLSYIDSDFSVLLSTDFPDISNQIRNSSKIRILGASLHSTAHNYFDHIQIALNKGAEVKILTCEPINEISSIQVRRTYVNDNPDSLSRSIIDNLNFLKKLEVNSNGNSSLELKTIDVPISFGIISLHLDDDQIIYVKLMPFKLPGYEYLHFKLSLKHQYELYKHFENQFEKTWTNGKAYD